jgi:hypothetical protein
MSYLEDAPPNASPTSGRSSIRTRYSTPGMTHRLDVSSCQAVSGSSAIALETISLPVEDAAPMPVTRDLSATRPMMIQAWIEHGCSEGGSGA